MMMKVDGDDLDAIRPNHISTCVDADSDSDNPVFGDIGNDRRPRHASQCDVNRCINSEGG